MNQRPYLKKSVKELEALFSQVERDPTVLNHLRIELDYRSTQRALDLKEKVVLLRAHYVELQDPPLGLRM